MIWVRRSYFYALKKEEKKEQHPCLDTKCDSGLGVEGRGGGGRGVVSDSMIHMEPLFHGLIPALERLDFGSKLWLWLEGRFPKPAWPLAALWLHLSSLS